MKMNTLLLVLSLGLLPLAAHAAEGTADRLYVLDCGHIHLADQGRYISPGINSGQPIDLLDSCYLIRHGRDYLLWETGYPDAITGQQPAPGPIQGTRRVTLASQLAKIGVKPAGIRFVAVSHSHGDHSGGVELFASVPVLIQKAEYDFAFAPGKQPPFSPSHAVQKVEGDMDVFGDGSVTLLSTPGHTPGHQSLLVHLKKSGWVVLAGDAVQTQDSWKNRWAPGNDKEHILASMDRIAEFEKKDHAQIWSSHDPLQAEQQRKERKYFE